MTELNEKLLREAALLSATESALRLPVAVLLGEAVDVVGFCRKYWRAERSPVTGAEVRPGLELAGESGPLAPQIVDEISALERLTYEAHRSYMLAVGPATTDDSRARAVLSELTAALDWAFDDERHDEWDLRLSKLREQHERRFDTQDGLALALEDYAGLAEMAKALLAQIPAFDARLIAEAQALASSVRARSAPRDDAEAARELSNRNRYATLLLRRMQRVRRAARFVFRHHPEIAQKATSAYERRKRNAARRRADAESPERVEAFEAV